MENNAPSDSPTPARLRQKHRRVRPRAENPLAFLAHALLLVGAGTAVFLAAGVPQGSTGIFLVCAGTALVVCPPQVKVDGWLWLAATALILCAATAFLPAHWFTVPAWRRALESLPVVPLPTTVTPVPWQTGFWLALLACTALIGLFMLAQPVRSPALLALASMASLVCGVFAGLAIYAKGSSWHYPFSGDASFGFFPNRNHTATFLLTGGILAMGILGVTLRSRRWFYAVMAGGGLTLCVTALFFYSASRGGVVFLLVGTLIWLAGLGRNHRSGPVLISCVAVQLAAGTLFLTSGSVAQTRLAALVARSTERVPADAAVSPAAGDKAAHHSSMAEGDTPLDLRVLIYKDTLPLIRAFPFTGTGLGTFGMVFPQYRNASLSEMRSVHPESDWLMLVAEAGIPALGCVLAIIWLLTRRLRPLTEHPFWPLRWGCVAAAMAAILHGLVDVPAHHVSLGWWILVVAGLGLQPGRAETQPRSRIQHAAFVIGGLAMLGLGTQLIRAEWFGAPPFPPFKAERIQADLVRAYEHHDTETAARLAREAIIASPMGETFYFEWGTLELPFADSTAEVDAAFKAERVLDPNGPSIPLRQGEAWIHYDSARTVALWLDALSRRQRMDRLAGVDTAASVGFYRDLLGQSSKWPDVQRGLLAATAEMPAFALTSLEAARPELVKNQFERFSKESSFLDRLSADERRRFLLAWYTTGDRGRLTQFIADREDWQVAAWPVRIRQWVDAQEFERAVREAAKHYQISLAFSTPGDDGSSDKVPQQEAADPVTAFHTYLRDGNTVAARRVLAEAGSNAAHPVPPEIWRLKAADAVGRSDWGVAWQSLQQYIRAVHEGGSL